ncbi:hypothetical protein BC831DRAFT_456152 [Entophlyctis helioformis]|nr:hypothetical protein BC831DRAFT_456152 [Entophlyctis helioformis]
MAWRQQLAALRHRLAPLQNLGNLPTPLPDSGAAQTTRLVHSKDLRSDLASLLSCFMPPSAAAAAHSASADQQHSEHPQDRLYRQFGFKLDIRPSQIPHAGNGVYLCGHRPVPGSIVAMYPGTVYNPGEPTLLVSLANHYLLRCFDGLLVDGKARGLSGSVYRSLHSRHHPDPRVPSVGDRSWMDYARHGDSSLRNPLAIGQIINAASPTQVANGVSEWPAARLSLWQPTHKHGCMGQ